MEKFRSNFEKDSAWAESFNEDDEELIEGIQNPQQDEQEFDHAFFGVGGCITYNSDLNLCKTAKFRTCWCLYTSYKNGLVQLQFEIYINLCSLLFITSNNLRKFL